MDMTKTAEKKINEGADRLQDGIEKGRKGSIHAVESASSLVEDAIENAKLKGESAWEKAKETGQDLIDEVESTGQKAWKNTKTYVQKRPFQAIGYAVLFGAVLGAFLGRKRN